MVLWHRCNIGGVMTFDIEVMPASCENIHGQVKETNMQEKQAYAYASLLVQNIFNEHKKIRVNRRSS